MLGLCASLVGPPAPQFSRQAGDVWYSHAMLSRDKHLIRLSTGGLLFGSNGDRLGELQAFADRYAAQTCGTSFSLTDASPSWPKMGAVYAKQYVFHCVRGGHHRRPVIRSKG
jgi:hypothetical protein